MDVGKTNNVHTTQYGSQNREEENKKVDPYRCIIDTGCPKTVAGEAWMDAYIESQGESVIIRTGKEDGKI